MPADRIAVNYEALGKVAAQLEQESLLAQSISASLHQQIEQLHDQGGWMSDTADQFYAEMFNEVLPALNRLVQALGAASVGTKNIQQTFAAAEDEAASAFLLRRK